MQLVVAEKNGQIIRLGQVADALDGTQEQRSLALYWQRDSTNKAARRKGSDRHRHHEIERLQHDRCQQEDSGRDGASAEDTSARREGSNVVRDSGVRVAHSVRNVEEALLEGALLTVLVVFIFLNSWRSTVITGLALPVSVLASFIAVWAFGFTLNTMSLLGLSLAIGILIDDAIVVRENIVRHIEMGKDHMTAAHEGTDEIGLAVAATTFSIVAVFVPIAFMYGVAGQWFKPFALTIACAVLVSLLVSFSLDPMLSAYWADPQVEAHERKNPIARTLDRFNVWFNKLAERYKKVIGWALDHRLAMVGLAIASFVDRDRTSRSWACRRKLLRIGRSIGAQPSASKLLPVRISITRESRPRKRRALRASIPRFSTRTRRSAARTGAVDNGNIYVRLVPKHKRDIGAEDLGDNIRKEVGRIGGATMTVYTNRFPGTAEADSASASRRNCCNAQSHAAEQIGDAGEAGERRRRCRSFDEGTEA